MPTPAGQALIPPPWIGQGSLSSIYDADVVNDHKAADGWALIYNTFDPNATGPLNNPYFMLYNKYRGLLRVYLYTTTQFIASSTYLQDGLSVVSNANSSMLNFVGSDLIDVSSSKSSYSQMQPAPKDGSLPLGTNKWYMLQYEIAYDSSIATTSFQNIRLSWFTNYYGVSNISLGGNIEGTMTSTVGASDYSTNVFNSLANGGKVVGKGVFAGIGSQFLTRNTKNEADGSNKIGVPNNIFKAAVKGITGALTGSIGDIPGALTNVFSAIFGGSSAGTTTTFNVNATMTLNGTSTSGGSFPSSPTSVWVPGSIITPVAQNYVPLVNKTMGVFNMSSKLVITVRNWTTRESQGGRPPVVFIYYGHLDIVSKNNASKIVINPDVLDAATVTIEKQDALIIPKDPNTFNLLQGYNGPFEEVGEYSKIIPNPSSLRKRAGFDVTYALRVTLKVVPKNGAPTSIIVKTFLADENNLGKP